RIAVSCVGLPQVCNHGEQRPLARHAFEGADTATLEANTRARDEILHSVRDEDFPWRRVRSDSRPDMHRDTSNLGADHFTLGRVKTSTKLDAKRSARVADSPRASYGPGGTVKGGKDPVTSGIDLTPARAGKLAADQDVIPLKHLAPTAVAEGGGLRGG